MFKFIYDIWGFMKKNFRKLYKQKKAKNPPEKTGRCGKDTNTSSSSTPKEREAANGSRKDANNSKNVARSKPPTVNDDAIRKLKNMGNSQAIAPASSSKVNKANNVSGTAERPMPEDVADDADAESYLYLGNNDDTAKIEKKVSDFASKIWCHEVFLRYIRSGGDSNYIVDTARYLYSNGYLDKTLELLGMGSFNCVFRIKGTNRVVKYCKSMEGYNNGVSVDEMSLRELENMMGTIKDQQLKKWANKYLPKIKRMNNRDIYEDDLGITDLRDAFDANKRHLKANKTLDSLLKISERSAKGTKVFHDNGYVHRDIKPENILKVSNSKYAEAVTAEKEHRPLQDKHGQYYVVKKAVSEDGKDKIQYFKKYIGTNNVETPKIKKRTVIVTDVGLMKKIDDILHSSGIQDAGTPGFIAQDAMTCRARTPEDVKKWDIYALGITFYYLLFNHMPPTLPGVTPLYFSCSAWSDTTDFNTMYVLHPNTFNSFAREEAYRVFYYLKLINLMTLPSPFRILIDEVLKKIEYIKKMKKN